MPKIYIVIGKSATGKDTIYKKLVEQKEIELKTIVGYTTRPIRSGEKDGVEYYFVDEQKLLRLQKENRVIEHRAYKTVYGVWNYFTVNDGQINLSEYNYIMIGTLETYEQIQNYYGATKVVPLYLEVEDGIRLQRALNREKSQESPKYAEMCRRFLADEEDFSKENIKRLGITKKYQNIEMDQCFEEICKEIKKEMKLIKSNL